jgi:hypothetical protein
VYIFSSTSYHSNGQASVEPKQAHFSLSSTQEPTHPTPSTKARAAEMNQKAANAASMTLSSIMTLSMPSKAYLMARYELQILATTTMTNEDHS